MDLSVRRAQPADVPAVRAIYDASATSGPHAWQEKYGPLVNFTTLVETSFLSVVVEDDQGEVVGFAALDTAPRAGQANEVPAASWDHWLAENFTVTLRNLCPANTFWLSLMIATPATADQALVEVLRTMVTTVPTLQTFLFAVPSKVGLFAPMTGMFQPVRAAHDGSVGTAVFYCEKGEVVPPLHIRQGVVEDFDDLMPLLQAGEGVLTTPPEEFYLDETLDNQDDTHSVLVAEDPATGQIVGLACMSSSHEEQLFITKHYSTEVYNKLRPTGENTGVNTFQVTFFYLNPAYEDRAASFVAPMFEQFPNAEYGAVALLHTTTEHPLLADFSYVPLKQGLTQDNGIYLLSRTRANGIWILSRKSLTPLTVRQTTEEDLVAMEGVLDAQGECSPESARKMLTLAAEAVPGETCSYVALHEGRPVGMCHMKYLSPEEVHNLRCNYDFEEYVNFVPDGKPDYRATNIDPNAPDERCNLSATVPTLLVTHFYIRPVFRNRIRTFIREAMRQSDTQLVTYVLSLHDEAYRPLLDEMILAMPRRIIEEPQGGGISGGPPGGVVGGADQGEELLALHLLSAKQLSDEKTKIYARIVVVGASTTGLAAIYAWLKIPYLLIANIVLVSRDGVPKHPNNEDSEHWGLDSLTWLEREYILFRIGGKVRVIEGTMVEFERNEKYIIADNGFIEPYDHLVITAGRQYSIPKDLASKHLAKNGMFELSSLSQIHRIKQHIRESEAYEDELSNAVIYGSSKDVYCVATSLASIGLSPSRLVIVSPDNTTTEATSIFEDPLVDMKVDKLMESLGAKTYKGHVLERMDYDEDHNLSSVYIAQHTTDKDESKKKLVEIPATMFIYCHEKDIDGQILSALNKRSIVFDGRVIVKHNYRTTDPDIYAVGPIAMFSGRFGPSDEFEAYNPLEVGTRFAETVLGFIGVEEFLQEDQDEGDQQQVEVEDPTQLNEVGKSRAAGQPARPIPLPKYTEKVSSRVLLPNDYHYFRCRSARYSDNASRMLHLTSSNAKGDNYIKISIGPNKCIEAITFLGSEDIEVHNLRTLVGFPESLLNLVYAYEQSRNARGQHTMDLLEYLRSKRSYAVYHSTFPQFFDNLRQQLMGVDETQRLRARIAEYIERNGVDEIDDKVRQDLVRSVCEEGAVTRRTIELEMIKFLHANKQYFPTIYYLPAISKWVPDAF